MERIEMPNMVEPLRANRYTIETEGVYIPEQIGRAHV